MLSSRSRFSGSAGDRAAADREQHVDSAAQRAQRRAELVRQGGSEPDHGAGALGAHGVGFEFPQTPPSSSSSSDKAGSGSGADRRGWR